MSPEPRGREALAPTSAALPEPGSRPFRSWLTALALVLVVLPLCVWAAFSAHEPYCDDSEAFWTGDLPTSPGVVGGVILGSSQMGLDLDVYALDRATGEPWVRVARHAVEHASIPRTYARMLGSSAARPGLAHLVIEVSPLLFDEVGCERPELPGLPLRLPWFAAVRGMLGVDAELAPALAMGWLPHRAVMTSGRRHDLAAHAKRPGHALQLLGDLRHVFHGFSPPARWAGEPVPDLTPERIERRRRFLFGGPLEGYVPRVSALCLRVLERTVAEAHAGKTLLLLPPLRTALRDAIPAAVRSELRGALQELSTRMPTVSMLDATDLFAAEEAANFTDFDHLNPVGAAGLTTAVAAALR